MLNVLSFLSTSERIINNNLYNPPYKNLWKKQTKISKTSWKVWN